MIIDTDAAMFMNWDIARLIAYNVGVVCIVECNNVNVHAGWRVNTADWG